MNGEIPKQHGFEIDIEEAEAAAALYENPNAFKSQFDTVGQDIRVQIAEFYRRKADRLRTLDSGASQEIDRITEAFKEEEAQLAEKLRPGA